MSEVPERLNAERWYVDGRKPAEDPKWKPETVEESKARLARKQVEMQAELDGARAHNQQLIDPIISHILEKPDSASSYGGEQASFHDSDSDSYSRIDTIFLTIERGSQKVTLKIPGHDTKDGLPGYVYLEPIDIKPQIPTLRKANGDYPGAAFILDDNSKRLVENALDLAKKQAVEKKASKVPKTAFWKFWKK